MQEKLIDNLKKNICRFFHFLVQFLFTTSETELDFHYEAMNTHVASLFSKPFRHQDLWKLENFKKITKMIGFDGEYLASHPKDKFRNLL